MLTAIYNVGDFPEPSSSSSQTHSIKTGIGSSGTGANDFRYTIEIRRVTSSGGNISGGGVPSIGAFSPMRRDAHVMTVPITGIDAATTSTQYYRLYLSVPDDDGRGRLGLFKGIIIGVR